MNWCRLVPELTVMDFEKSVNFYVNTIGFEIKYSRSHPQFAYLEFEGAQIMIEEFHQDGWNLPGMEYPLGRGMNLQIECNDVVSIKERLLNSGHSLFMDITENWYQTEQTSVGNKEFIVQDPDGYMIRFAQDLGTRNRQH
jgi:catechol 2,3-dioxygenase-like lactoylglutathione lyase family enzyme